ncbi:hypothetical protein J4438_02085 [Candidatus Woesearchaeota archaeon]|nr:hypothetical protein [Candidatus Woesearchaeota archaeon]
MNKLFLIIISLILLSTSVFALTSVDSEFVDPDNHSVELGNTVHVKQGETATFWIYMTTNTNKIGYRIFYQDSLQDIVPHTVYTECQAPNFCDFVEYLDISTSSLPLGSHNIIVSANDDGIPNLYDMSKTLTLVVDPVPVNHAPTRPSNPNPAVGSINLPNEFISSWTASDEDGDVLKYSVYLSKTANFYQENIVATNLQNPSFTFTNLDHNTKYYWKVVASDGKLQTESFTWDFRTMQAPVGNQAPNAPKNPFPADNSTAIERTLTLTWEGTDPNNDPLTYTVYFGTSSNPTTIVAKDISTNSYTVDYTLAYQVHYYWKVVANDGLLTKEGPVWGFSTISQNNPTNHAPVIQNIEDKRARCNVKFTYSVTATDQDNDLITFSDNTNLFNINSATGLISFTPSCSDRGDYNIIITATDSKGAKTTETFNLEIYRTSSGSSSGGSSSNNDDDEDDETIILTESFTLDSEKEDCLQPQGCFISQGDIQEEQQLYDANFTAILLIALGVVVLGLIIMLIFYKNY